MDESVLQLIEQLGRRIISDIATLELKVATLEAENLTLRQKYYDLEDKFDRHYHTVYPFSETGGPERHC